MLLDTLNALNLAGAEALESICGLQVKERDLSLVREGRQNLRSLVTLKLKGCPLQMVHLGCDEALAEHLVSDGSECESGGGLNGFARGFMTQLLDKFDGRHPRGTVEDQAETPSTLHTRGVRTFQVRLDTDHGQLSLLVEVPSRTELAIAKGSEFLTSMESIYLPRDWHVRQELTDADDVDNFLAFLRKSEADVYLETPAGDGIATLNWGLLIEVCHWDDRPALKLVTDYLDPARGIPKPGAPVEASVGIDDRSLEFGMTYLAPAGHELAPDTRLPCALFSVPRTISIGQRRQAFRVPISPTVSVELEPAGDGTGYSPWGDRTEAGQVVTGCLVDLSFSGARILTDHSLPWPRLQRESRVLCRVHFPDMQEPLQVVGIVRRLILNQPDRDQVRDEIGLEFLVSNHGDRASLDFIRQYVLEVQRAHLAQRLQVTST
jgi:hypothetical protein